MIKTVIPSMGEVVGTGVGVATRKMKDVIEVL
jgi:hypothetical protein